MDIETGLAGVIGAVVGAVSAAWIKARGEKQVGMTQAQAQMLLDAWTQVNAQREIIQRQDAEIVQVRDQVRNERVECDRRLGEMQAQIDELRREIQ